MAYDNLDIVIKGSTDEATKSIDKAISSLKKLERTVEGIKIEAPATANLDKLVESLNKYGEIKKPSLSKATANQITDIAEAASKVTDSSNFAALIPALESYARIEKPNLTASHANALVRLNEAIAGVTPESGQKLEQLGKSMHVFNLVSPEKLNASVNQLGRLPKAFEKLQEIDIGKLAPQIKELTETMRPLAAEMEKVAAGFDAMPNKLQKYIKEMDKVTESTGKATSSSKGLMSVLSDWRSTLIVGGYFAKRVSSSIAGFIDEANMYIENINLFTVTMGEGADAALRYAQAIENAMGIDHSEWIKQQGVFKQIVGGFGVAEERANQMSQGLNQLVYDAASFFDVTVQASAEKFESAMTGMSRPLRVFGYDISQAALQEEALAMGIEKSVSLMSRAEKAQLTYITLMNQSKNVMHDMARTIVTPANALRIFNMEITRLKRAIGQMLIPLVQMALPYLQAFTELLIMGANALAALLGYEPPKIDYSSLDARPLGAIEDGYAGIDDAAQGATKSAKEFQNFLLGFDEMNIMPSDRGGLPSGLGGGIGGLGDVFEGIEMPMYDFMEQLPKITSEAERIKNKILELIDIVVAKIKPFWDYLSNFAEALLIMFGLRKLTGWVGNLATALGDKDGKVAKAVSGLIAIIGGVYVGYKTTFENIRDWKLSGEPMAVTDIIETILGIGTQFGLTILGLKQMGVPWPEAFALSLLITTVTQIKAYFDGIARAAADMRLDELYGDISLTKEQAQNLARQLGSTDWSIQVEAFGVKYDALVRIADQLDADWAEIKRLRRLGNLGVQLEPDEQMSAAKNVMSSLEEYLFGTEDLMVQALTALRGADSDLQNVFSQEFLEDFDAFKSIAGVLTADFERYMADEIDAADLTKAIDNAMDQFLELKERLDSIWREIEAAELEIEFKASVGGMEITSGLDFESASLVYQDLLQQDKDRDSYQRGILATAIGMTNASRTLTPLEKQAEIDQHYRDYFAKRDEHLKYTMIPFSTDYASEIGRWQPNWGAELADMRWDSTISNGLFAPGGGWVEFKNDLEQWEESTSNLGDKILNNFASVSKAEKLVAEDQWGAFMGADFERLMRYADERVEAGVKVNGDILDRLSQYSVVGALADQEAAEMYLIGERLANSPEVLKLLEVSGDIGKSLNTYTAAAIKHNSYFVDDEIKGLVWMVGDTMLELTPELLRNLEAMGIEVPKAFSIGVGNGEIDLNQSLSTILVEAKNLLAEHGVDIPNVFFDYFYDSFENRTPGIETSVDLFTNMFGQLIATWGWGELPMEIEDAIKAGTDLVDLYSAGNSMAYIAETLGQKFGTPFANFITENWRLLDQLLAGTVGAANAITEIKAGASIYTYSSRTAGSLGRYTFADGGFPTSGEMFIAREAGPELVGTIGGRTAVANNDQIVDGIRAGVYEGVAMAMAGSSGAQGDTRVIVQVGDKTVADVVFNEMERRNQRSGKKVVTV